MIERVKLYIDTQCLCFGVHEYKHSQLAYQQNHEYLKKVTIVQNGKSYRLDQPFHAMQLRMHLTLPT